MLPLYSYYTTKGRFDFEDFEWVGYNGSMAQKKDTKAKKASSEKKNVKKDLSVKKDLDTKKDLSIRKAPVEKRERNEKRNLITFVAASVAVLVFTGLIIGNFGTIKDFFIGLSYHPSSEMSEIRDKLQLTGTGARIFNASLPELMEKAEFNYNCREIENESAILGCYTNDKIYIYNIVDEELPGIRELTSAHELLHAVYRRMSESERGKWNDILTKVYEDNQKILGEEIEIYDENERMEELYVRAGTEVKNLPEELERHYAEIFENQDGIVDFYESYIAVFRKIEQKMDELLEKAKNLEADINSKTADYEKRAEKLNADVAKFNECAGTMNCFASSAAFYNERAGLVAEQNALTALYDEINEMISKYNTLVTEYNENVLHGQILNMTINSSAKVEEVSE